MYVCARIHVHIRIASVQSSSAQVSGRTGSVPGKMPAKGQQVWRPQGSQQDPRWISAVAHRLDRVREELGRSAEGGDPTASGGPIGTEPSAVPPPGAVPTQQERHAGVQPRGQPTAPAEELAALRLARTEPSAFNIQRHAVMVCGRPVVVPPQQSFLCMFDDYN